MTEEERYLDTVQDYSDFTITADDDWRTVSSDRVVNASTTCRVLRCKEDGLFFVYEIFTTTDDDAEILDSRHHFHTESQAKAFYNQRLDFYPIAK